MDPKTPPTQQKPGNKIGQGFNDARGEIPDKKPIPKHNGLNVDNDPAHLREKREGGKVEGK